jgi:hypothetical protein
MENDGFFALEYSSGIFELYTFYEHVHERGITRKDLYYTISATEDGLDVSPGITYEVPSYNAVAVGDYEGFYWMKETWDSIQSFWNAGEMIDLVLKNNTQENIHVSVYDTHYYNNDRYKNYGSITIEVKSHNEGRYRFPVKMISLHKRIRIAYSFWWNSSTPSYPIYLDYNDNQIIPNKTQVIFNEFGYELQFNN